MRCFGPLVPLEVAENWTGLSMRDVTVPIKDRQSASLYKMQRHKKCGLQVTRYYRLEGDSFF